MIIKLINKEDRELKYHFVFWDFPYKILLGNFPLETDTSFTIHARQ